MTSMIYMTIKFKEERMDIFAEEVNEEIYTLQSNLTRRGNDDECE